MQIGLLPAPAGRPAVPTDLVVARELQVLGSHGLAAHDYPRLLALVATRHLPLARPVRRDTSPRRRTPGARRGRCGAGVTVLRP